MIIGSIAGSVFGCTTCSAEIFRYTGGAGKTTADWKLNYISNTNT
jgi:ribosomal protein S27E